MSGPRRISPPLAWIIALAFVSPLLLSVLAPIEIVEPAGLRGANEYHYRHDLDEFLNLPTERVDRPRGVMLAMSGGSCALVGPRQLAPDGVEMYVVFYPGATLERFDGLLDMLVDSNPDFIVVQDGVVTLALVEPVQFDEWVLDRYSETRSYWTGQLLGIARHFGVQRIEQLEDDNSWRCHARALPKSKWASKLDSERYSELVYSERQRKRVIEILSTFTAAEIPVLFVGAPMNTYTADYMTEVHQAARELVANNSALSSTSFHRPSSPLPESDFFDPVHLWPHANSTYREWLNDEIIRVLQDRSD